MCATLLSFALFLWLSEENPRAAFYLLPSRVWGIASRRCSCRCRASGAMGMARVRGRSGVARSDACVCVRRTESAWSAHAAPDRGHDVVAPVIASLDQQEASFSQATRVDWSDQLPALLVALAAVVSLA